MRTFIWFPNKTIATTILAVAAAYLPSGALAGTLVGILVIRAGVGSRGIAILGITTAALKKV
jgi:hypothetical protein